MRGLALEGYKWDAQIGDECSIAPFALIISPTLWSQLASWAEALTAELLAIEGELKERPALREQLGLPRPILEACGRDGEWSPAAARVIRYDFHPTTRGWCISEANTDVPGGYTESSLLPKHVQRLLGEHAVVGDPANWLADALARSARNCGCAALVAAPGYIEDQQIVAYVASLLRARGVQPILCRPEQVNWTADGFAFIASGSGPVDVDVVFRFYQGEWLAPLPARHWVYFFRGGQTPACNPGSSILIESKRLPLLADALSVSTPTWRKLMPGCREPRFRHLARPEPWVFKAAYSNNGDAVVSCELGIRAHRLAALQAALRPRNWVVQQRFDPVWMQTPCGVVQPCFGVYTIDGRAAGIYGRVSPYPIIDYRARDVAVLLEN